VGEGSWHRNDTHHPPSLHFIVAGLLAALLVGREAVNFSVVQGMIALLVLVASIAAFAFWRRKS